MCRSIKTLRGQEPTTDEVRAAALQFVRKVSGYRAPSRANTDAFEGAVDEVAESTRRLLQCLGTALPVSPVAGPRPAAAIPPTPSGGRPATRQRHAAPGRVPAR